MHLFYRIQPEQHIPVHGEQCSVAVKGHLQTDGYAAYNIFDTQKDVTLLHCMAHARRKFVEARLNDQARADYVLDHIQQLYAIERKAADEQLSEVDVLQLRQGKAMPILEAFRQMDAAGLYGSTSQERHRNGFGL
jgi:Transposase IS66 family